jgi:ubiquinone/menaquinone biosynthesis C-methylase UbiE
MNTSQIDKRYSELATDTCCLSCGNAIQFSKVKKGEVTLDMGCGRGADVIRLATEAGEDGFAYGLDVSDGMLKRAEKTARKTGVQNVKFLKSELETIPLENESVNLVISNCTINHASNKQRVWDEIYRVLKHGGRFVVSDIYATREVPEKYKNDPQAVAECWAGSDTRDVYLKTLNRTGFKNVTILEESSPYPKGSIEVVSFTIASEKPEKCCCCS